MANKLQRFKFNIAGKRTGWEFIDETSIGGSFSGTMDDITDGSTYVKTENNYTDAEKIKLGNLSESSGLTQSQILARNLGC